MAKKGGVVRAGIGGWTFEPWRGTFYPEGLPQRRSSATPAAHVPTIEVNGTFYRTQTPTTFAKWASETPDGFVFALKGPRYAVNRRVLAEAGESIKRFLDSGPTALGDKLGPMLWQFAPTKKFDEADFGAFLELLPREAGRARAAPRGGGAARHVHACRPSSKLAAQVTTSPSSSPSTRTTRPSPTSPATSSTRGCRQGKDAVPTAMRRRRSTPGPARASTWAEGERARRPAARRSRRRRRRKPRDVFVYFIHEGKVRAPHARHRADEPPRQSLDLTRSAMLGMWPTSPSGRHRLRVRSR